MNENDYTQIYEYLNGTLSPEALEAFEGRLGQEPELAAQLAFHKDLQQGIELAGDQDLKSKIKSALAGDQQLKKQIAAAVDATPSGGETKDNARVFQLFSRRTLAIAASVLVLIVAGYFFINQDLNPSTTTAATYYQADQLALDQTLEKLELKGMAIPDKNRRTSLKQALEPYQSENFETAQQNLSAHLTQFPNDLEATYFLGLCNMELENYEAAVQHFDQVANQPDYENVEGAQWYGALANLIGDIEPAKTAQILQQITQNPDHRFFSEASALLKALNE